MEHDGNVYPVLKGLSNGKIDGVAMATDVIVDFYNFDRNHHVLGLTDMIRPISLTFFFQKHSLLTAMFNQKIGIFRQAGLIVHWAGKYTCTKLEKKRRKSKSLDLPCILTILKISSALHLIASIVFVLEVLSDRFQCIRKWLDFITY